MRGSVLPVTPRVAGGPAAEPIGDYAILGDGRSAALVSRSGSIDWLCWPRFDSPSLLGALLDPGAGFWRLAPERVTGTERRYVPGTNVLETRFRCEGGELVLSEFMPVASEEDPGAPLKPENEILRIARCDGGEVDLDMI